MESFINNDISEIKCGFNFSYVLEDNSSFLSTEYKVIQSQSNSCFVKCMKMMYNGKIQLYYLTEKNKTLSSMIPLLDEDDFITICGNLLAAVIYVKNNGFLTCQNIDISFDKVYVDQATYKVSLVYLPTSKRLFDDFSGFENELRTGLIKIIQSTANLYTAKTNQLITKLSDGSLSLENLYEIIKNGELLKIDNDIPFSGYQSAISGEMRIVALNAPEKTEIIINKNEFTIGKKADAVDGIVSFNKMISRLHCKITKNENGYFVTDLTSANGTYINGKKLVPNQPYVIKGGNVLRLADSDFKVIVD